MNEHSFCNQIFVNSPVSLKEDCFCSNFANSAVNERNFAFIFSLILFNQYRMIFVMIIIIIINNTKFEKIRHLYLLHSSSLSILYL